ARREVAQRGDRVSVVRLRKGVAPFRRQRPDEGWAAAAAVGGRPVGGAVTRLDLARLDQRVEVAAGRGGGGAELVGGLAGGGGPRGRSAGRRALRAGAR